MLNRAKENLTEFLQIKNATDTSADLYFYGDIVSSMSWYEEDQYPDAVKKFLDDAKGKNLNIYMNSGGGSVFAGMAIYNMLKRHQGNKTVYVDGLAASIASVIALAGDKVIIPSNAYFMIHKPWTIAMGDANEFRKTADTLDTIEQGILNVYEDNLAEGIDVKAIKKMVNEETWLTGDQASQYFKNIEVSPAIEAVAYTGELKFNNTPEQIQQNAQVIEATSNGDEQNHQDEAISKHRAKLKLLKLKGEQKHD
jgi:ATP-dependent protease ClpP protease subunit